MINDNINMLSDNNFYREEDDAERRRAEAAIKATETNLNKIGRASCRERV